MPEPIATLVSPNRPRTPPDAEGFIRANLRLAPVPAVPEVRIYRAHSGTGLWRLARGERAEGPAPFWAYPWAGGAALARHVFDAPLPLHGRRVLDLGTGSGLVGIAAALAGAAEVVVVDVDPVAIVAARLNAAANGVTLTLLCDDLTGAPPPKGDLVLVGDLFYEPALALRVTAFLGRCREAGLEVLVGDPGRAFLPYHRLRPAARYPVPDVGGGNSALSSGTVFTFV